MRSFTLVQTGDHVGGGNALPLAQFLNGSLKCTVEPGLVFDIERILVGKYQINFGSIRKVGGLVEQDATVLDMSTMDD